MQYWKTLTYAVALSLLHQLTYAQQCTTGTILNQEDFNSGTSGTWMTFDVLGNDSWEFDLNEATINGFDGSGATGEEDWLISPTLDFSAGLDWQMDFEFAEQFNGPNLEVFYSEDYNGFSNPNAASWILLATLPDVASSSFQPFNIDLSNLNTSDTYIAFKYTATGGGPSETQEWTVDNICISDETNTGGGDCEAVSGDYYACIEDFIDNGGRCAELKTQLFSLIDDHIVLPYTGTPYDVWDFMCEYDLILKDGSTTQFRIWDVFSDNPNGPEPYEYECSDMGGSASGEGQGFNRDHVFPRSWWGGSQTADQFSDVNNLLPSDIYVNSRKSNFPLGEVNATNYLSDNGSRIGSPNNGCAANVFEPIDEYKGDFARMYFYMATRYESQIAGWENSNNQSNEALAGNSYPVFESCLLNRLLKWHKDDPVSQKELDRNEGVFIRQNNRNPYIDHPEYVDLVWGISTNGTNITTACGSVLVSSCDYQGDAIIVENPAMQEEYRVEGEATFSITVPSGNTILATAGVSITLADGTAIQNGSDAHFFISDCTMVSNSNAAFANDLLPLEKDFPITKNKVVEIQTTPNPFVDKVQLKCHLHENSPVVIRVLQLNGRQQYKRRISFLEKGMHQFDIPSEQWQKGMYYVVVTTNQARYTQMILKM
ncbi:MAG: endonuclease [Bacteroidota bacterium]